MNTLVRAWMIGVATPLFATAQVPPARPAEPAKPLVTPRPRAEPLHPGLEDLRFHAEELRMRTKEMAHVEAEALRDFARTEAAQIRVQVEELRHLGPVNADEIRRVAEEARHLALMDAPLVSGLGPSIGYPDRLANARPRSGWAPEDPADSLYRVGREALNRGEYRRAAQVFNEVTKKYPRSVYALDAAYWEAFARYRTGGTDDLREALKILDEKSGQFASLRNHEGNEDAQALRARVLGALAARGDTKAAEELRKNASQSGSCDREEVSVRAEALSALGQMDMAAAMPVVKKVLQRRDSCTVELRRRALYVLGRQPTSEAVGLLVDVAKNDPESSIRGEALRWLPRVAGDSAVPQLEELLRTTADDQAQRSIVSALASMDSDRARRAIRTLIERSDASERVRAEAIVSIARERENRSVSPEELGYLRSLYARVETPRLKEAVIMAVGRVPSAENQQFLVGIVRNTNETASLRASALQRLGRMENVTAAEIARLYDVADARALREQIIYALSQRKEPEGLDKMIDIAKKDTDPQIRRTAINHITRLAQGGNERAKKFLQEIFDR